MGEDYTGSGLSHKPCIWTRNSVLIRRADSDSVSLREPHRESTSSMKMILGLCVRANSNKFRTSLIHTDTTHFNTHRH